MSITRTIFRLLNALAVCGLLAAPIARPAAAVTAHPTKMAAAASTDIVMDGMAEDMACCPKKVPPGCQDCPMMSLCQTSTIGSLTSDSYLITFSNSARVPPLLNEADLSGQAQGPPRRPPKV